MPPPPPQIETPIPPPGNVIPTPALLPGLIGLGVQIMRKRSQEEAVEDDSAEDEPET
ncbi:PTPA-CTERM sorting domain-containing protein [Thermoleptolyngbya sp. M55_K2018_002]|uniref:PTPA-CTERM sorting domain-containing protein n=1 Tax=Thermoleptolyngbya sp. M55_K2018_002 TaxID=2747808 RepID=UPI00345C650A